MNKATKDVTIMAAIIISTIAPISFLFFLLFKLYILFTSNSKSVILFVTTHERKAYKMFPLFTILFILFIIILTLTIKNKNANQEKLFEQFWNREREANSNLKSDISNLDYITIPEEFFSTSLETESKNALLLLKDKEMLNLTGYTNTDLKLKYGVLNFEKLAECDARFSEFVLYAPTYCSELLAAGERELAKQILEFAVDKNSDSKAIYTMLADIYIEDNEKEKISSLIDSAEKLNSLSKNTIVAALSEL